MRRLLVLMITSAFAGVAGAEPANDTVKGLDECFAQTRTADAICETLASNASIRLECLQKSRTAQQECLEHLRAGLASSGPSPPPPAVEPKPDLKASQRPPDKAPDSDKPAPDAAEASQSPDRSPTGSPPQETPGPPKPASPVANSPPPPEPRAPPTSGWIVSQTASPIDYSPLLVAELRSLTVNKPDAPSVLVLRCRTALTEISVRTQGRWRPTRAGDVEIVLANDERPAERVRWRLSPDGRSASVVEDAAKAVQGLSAGKLSIAVNDATGDVGTATFELAGIQAVREKLAAACHWSSVEAQSQPR